MRRAAFTLIEMLVVISLITLLISMLMPALGRAKESAMQVKCGSNLRNIGYGVTAYADENAGSLPTHHGGGLRPFTTYWINKSGSQLVRVNLGLLLDHVADPQAYYDPSLENEHISALSFNGPDNPWNQSLGNNPSAHDYRLRSSFPARSRQYEIGTGGTSNWKANDYDNQVIYGCFVGVDQWDGGGIINGKIIAPHLKGGNNLLFTDCSVYWVPYSTIAELRPISAVMPSALEQWQYYEFFDERP